MKDEMPLISIVVIGYNVENTISECLESCCNQKYERLQIIFVDDGSTDSTAIIVRGLLDKYTHLEYYYQNNQGANCARKKGFSLVKGTFVIFVDGDDMLINECVNDMYQIYKEDSNCDIYTYDYDVFDENGIVKQKHNYVSGKFSGKEYLEQILRHNTPHYLWNKMYSTNFLWEMPFHDIPSITMGDDLAACVRMGIKLPVVYASEKKLYRYRVNANSVSRKPNKKYCELLIMMEDIEATLSKHELLEQYNEELEYNYFILFLCYVVRNKYAHTSIQDMIYKAWKKRKVHIKSNLLISQTIQELGILTRILLNVTNNFFVIGRFLSRCYGFIAK